MCNSKIECIDIFAEEEEKIWRKKCPICKNPQEYTSKGSLVAAIKNNARCKKCYNKSKIKPIPKKGWIKMCPTCKKTIITYKNKGSLTEAIKNNTDCDSCSYKKRSLSPKEKEISKKRRKETKKAYNKKYQKERRKTDPKFRLRHNISSALSTALKERGMSKQGKSTFDLIGCSKNILIKHLESLFTENMSWDNYGEWVIDHIIPDIFFNYNDIVEFRICWRLENLRPMWKGKNREKSDKITLWGKEINAKNMERDYFSKIDSFHIK